MNQTSPFKVSKFHTYALTTPQGHPLFVAHVNYRSKPYCTYESCTSEGELTKHIIGYPITNPIKQINQDFDAWLLELSFGEPVTDTTLYEYFEELANEYLMGITDKPYIMSVAHRRDVLWCMQDDYLTDAQTKAIKQLTDHPDPWAGIKVPGAQRSQRRAEAQKRAEARAEYEESIQIENIKKVIPADYFEKYKWANGLPSLYINYVIQPKNPSTTRYETEGTLIAAISRMYKEKPRNVYLPPIEHFFDWNPSNFASRRWYVLPDRPQKWTKEEPWLPDLPCARMYWEAHPDMAPANLRGLSFDDMLTYVPTPEDRQ